MVDVLQVLEGAAYVGFIAGAFFAVLELRTMARARRTELMLRSLELFCSREFEGATVNVVKSKFERKKASDVDMKMIADYWDSMATMAKKKLVDFDLVGDILNYADVWELIKPWIQTWEERTFTGRYADFEWMAGEQRRRRLAAEQGARRA